MGNLTFCKKRSKDQNSIKLENQINTFHYSHSFHQRTWIIHKTCEVINFTPNNISLFTYNVWFEDFEFDERSTYIINMITTYLPTFLCLQEVTFNFLQKILKNTIFREKYYISGNHIKGYGLLMASIYPVSFFEYPLSTSMKRTFICAKYKFNDQNVIIGGVHLESGMNKEKRSDQLEMIFKILNKEDISILMGDFNFDNTEENNNIHQNFIDLWPFLNNESSVGGHTMKIKKGLNPWRPDKILMNKNKIFNASKIKMLGKDPLPKFKDFNDEEVGNFIITPSDHYAILADINVIENNLSI